MSEPTREERLEDLVRDLHRQLQNTGARIGLEDRANLPLLREVLAVTHERVRD